MKLGAEFPRQTHRNFNWPCLEKGGTDATSVVSILRR
jgi:hypothetical protein